MDEQGHKTGGRRPGSKNKRTVAREEATARAIAAFGEVIPDAFAGDAHPFLVPRTVIRNGSPPWRPLHVTKHFPADLTFA
jgi:hypothetical protein